VSWLTDDNNLGSRNGCAKYAPELITTFERDTLIGKNTSDQYAGVLTG